MALKIFFTSDLHLGMKFAGYPEVSEELVQARFDTLQRLVTLANEHQSDLFVIAGDLFDRVSVTKKDVLKAAHILKGFEGKLAAVLPGNHDFITEPRNDLWAHFSEGAGDRTLLLEKTQQYPLHSYDMDAVLYPAACTKKHSAENAIGWISDSPKDVNIGHHIGIAHGSLEGFSPDFNKTYYPMTMPEIQKAGINLWLLGHTHVRYPQNPGVYDKLFYAGTPEPDGFDCKHGGTAWLLDLSDDNKISAGTVPTGIYSFAHEYLNIHGIAEANKLLHRYDKEKGEKILLKVRLQGSLPRSEFSLLQKVRKNIKEQLFYLEWDDNSVIEEITPDIIRAEFTEGSFPYRLLTALSEAEEKDTLQMAYNLINEARI